MDGFAEALGEVLSKFFVQYEGFVEDVFCERSTLEVDACGGEPLLDDAGGDEDFGCMWLVPSPLDGGAKALGTCVVGVVEDGNAAFFS